MSDDLVKRLRDWEHVWPDDMNKPAGHLYEDAADRIEELEVKLAKALAFLDELRNEQCYDASVLIELIKELTGGNDE